MLLIIQPKNIPEFEKREKVIAFDIAIKAHFSQIIKRRQITTLY
jgi:hypothetical protein